MHKQSFAESTHEPPLLAGHMLSFLFVSAIIAVSAGAGEIKLGVTALVLVMASIGLWIILVVRIASATHASDDIHSTVVVPWFSSLSAVGLAVAPATFNIVPLIVSQKQ